MGFDLEAEQNPNSKRTGALFCVQFQDNHGAEQAKTLLILLNSNRSKEGPPNGSAGDNILNKGLCLGK